MRGTPWVQGKAKRGYRGYQSKGVTLILRQSRRVQEEGKCHDFPIFLVIYIYFWSSSWWSDARMSSLGIVANDADNYTNSEVEAKKLWVDYICSLIVKLCLI
jgi:hypothetical protein